MRVGFKLFTDIPKNATPENIFCPLHLMGGDDDNLLISEYVKAINATRKEQGKPSLNAGDAQDYLTTSRKEMENTGENLEIKFKDNLFAPIEKWKLLSGALDVADHIRNKTLAAMYFHRLMEYTMDLTRLDAGRSREFILSSLDSRALRGEKYAATEALFRDVALEAPYRPNATYSATVKAPVAQA